MISTIFFDFDGVILDSVQVKAEAFKQIYSEHGPEIVKAVEQHHLANGGMSRYKKMAFYHKEFLGIKLNDNELEILADRFSALVVNKVIESESIPGSLNFIESYHQIYDMYIISGTPQKEMRFIADSLHLSKKMKGVFGSPKKKEVHVDEIIRANNYVRSECLFIGDAQTDHTAAIKNNIRFLLIENKDNTSLFSGVKGIVRAKDLNHLQTYITPKC